MEILELAKSLGEQIKQSEQAKNAKTAEEVYESDAYLRSLIDEYNSLSEAYKTTEDDSYTRKIEERMSVLYDEITENPVYVNYVKTQTELSNLMEEINDEINFVVTGKRGCGHDGCEGCSGCH